MTEEFLELNVVISNQAMMLKSFQSIEEINSF